MALVTVRNETPVPLPVASGVVPENFGTLSNVDDTLPPASTYLAEGILTRVVLAGEPAPFIEGPPLPVRAPKAPTAGQTLVSTGDASFGVWGIATGGTEIVDDSGDPVTTLRARIVLDANGEIDDIILTPIGA